MALSFRRNGDATFSITVPNAERRLIEQLIPQMRELIEQQDPLIWRLLPNPYPEHANAASEYRELIGEELTSIQVNSLDTVIETLDRKRLDIDQIEAWMRSINYLRLTIGTRLEVQESSELDDYVGETERSLFETYNYLGFMLEQVVEAISGE